MTQFSTTVTEATSQRSDYGYELRQYRQLQVLLDDSSLPSETRQLIYALAASPFGFAVFGPQDSLLYLNSKGRELLKISDSDLEQLFTFEFDKLPEGLDIYCAHTQTPYPYDQLPHTIAAGGEVAWSDDIEVCRFGQANVLEMCAVPLKHRSNLVSFVAVVFRDVAHPNASGKFSFGADLDKDEYLQRSPKDSFLENVELPVKTDSLSEPTLLISILEQVADGVMLLDRNWQFQYCNSAAGYLLGQSPEDLNAISLWDVFSKQAAQPSHEAYCQSLSQQRPLCLEEYYPQENRWLKTRLHPNADGMVIYLTDITDHKHALLEIPADEVRPISLSEFAPVGLFRADANGHCLYVNDQWCEVTGLPFDQALGEGWIKALHPSDQPAVAEAWYRAARDGSPFRAEYRFLQADGQVTWVFGRAITEKNSQGEVIGYIGSVTDISKRKALELALKRQVERERTLNRIFQSIRNSLNLDAIFATATTETARLLNITSCSVVQYAPGQNRWQQMAAFEFPETNLSRGDARGHSPGQIKHTSPSLEQRTAILGNEFIIPLRQHHIVAIDDDEGWVDVTSDQYYPSILPEAIVPGAWVVVPLVVDGELWGSLTLHNSTEPWHWIEEQIQIVQAVSGQLEVAIYQTNLYQQLQQDLLDRRLVVNALQHSEERYRLLAENTNDLVCLHHLDGQYSYVSPSSQVLLGHHYLDLLNKNPKELIHEEDQGIDFLSQLTLASQGAPEPLIYRVRHRDGYYIWLETLVKPIFDSSGRLIQFQSTSRDVTTRVEGQKQLEYEALHDALTGLPNRLQLTETLQGAIQRGHQEKCYEFAVIFLDLDQFKVVNDSLGHWAGDRILISVAQKLQSILRSTDLAARLGGDEFVLLLDQVKDLEKVTQIIDRIFGALQRPIQIDGRQVYTSASAGIVMGDATYEEAPQLLRDADIAMYAAKNRGRACYSIFNPTMHDQALQRLHVENDLRQALENNEFLLHYQPIVCLKTGALMGLEALIRWCHPEEGMRSPGTFIGIAEETGLITPLDYWALREACRQLAEWHQKFPEYAHLRVSVNLSAKDLHQPDLVSYVDGVLEETQLNPNCLTLEITESMLIEDVEMMINLLAELRDRGIQTSIDDFGTGYSSLSYLYRLPVNYLKVDRSFVNKSQDDQRNAQIVQTIVHLSHQLGLKAIAEGLEMDDHLKMLQELGCELGQGYLFSKPLKVTTVESLLQAQQETFVKLLEPVKVGIAEERQTFSTAQELGDDLTVNVPDQ
ncbi:MAG: EAL domain-containing protein [Cyanobacteria bacterium P01_C01_bin.89]